jgi:hypothetical protein
MAHVITLLIIENELVKAKQKLDLSIDDFPALCAAILKELKLPEDETIVIAKPVEKRQDIVPIENIDGLGAKAKVQVIHHVIHHLLAVVRVSIFC